MAEEITVNTRIYPGSDGSLLSMIDLLTYFEKQGAMRVSDLHIKMGTVPAYRVDGELVKLKGAPITKELFEGLVVPLIGPKNIATLRRETAVDCSTVSKSVSYQRLSRTTGWPPPSGQLGLNIPKPKKSVPTPHGGYRPPQTRLVLFQASQVREEHHNRILIRRINENRARSLGPSKTHRVHQTEDRLDQPAKSAATSTVSQQPHDALWTDIIFVGEMRDQKP